MKMTDRWRLLKCSPQAIPVLHKQDLAARILLFYPINSIIQFVHGKYKKQKRVGLGPKRERKDVNH